MNAHLYKERNHPAAFKIKLLLLMCSSVLLVSCNPCRNIPKMEVASPDNRLMATAYERNCGATTDFSTVVKVESPAAKSNEDEGVVFVVKGRYDLSLEWRGQRALMIRCTHCSRQTVFRELTALGDVDISYEFAAHDSDE